VGVNLNTASKHLLAYVSGIGASIADNIVKYRNENGKFKNRKQLLKVPRLGDKAFEQCAGFLRINDGENVLDNSAVHPEAYHVAETIAKDLGLPIHELLKNEKVLNTVEYKKYKTETIGELTIKDIIEELKKPGLDPRAEAQQFEFANIFSIEDVHIGMDVPGVVTNITRFGAFIDIGVKQDGLVHVSEIAHKYITDPNEVLKLNQQVMVKVLEVDVARKRIALSIKQTEPAPVKANYTKPNTSFTPKENVDVPIGDALAMLKKKFGK
jgi:protein Tex